MTKMDTNKLIANLSEQLARAPRYIVLDEWKEKQKKCYDETNEINDYINGQKQSVEALIKCLIYNGYEKSKDGVAINNTDWTWMYKLKGLFAQDFHFYEHLFSSDNEDYKIVWLYDFPRIDTYQSRYIIRQIATVSNQ